MKVDLNALTRASRDELVECWQQTFGQLPPPRVHRTLLAGGLAWHLQMQNQSSWSPTRIRKMLEQASGRKLILPPGTHLIREWQGRRHQVTVLAAGFGYEGRTYRSLTAITREITGISWSGPRFFGIKP